MNNNISDNLLKVYNNVPEVYASGYKIGYGAGYNSGKNDVEGFSNEFWNTYLALSSSTDEETGEIITTSSRSIYRYAFAGSGWYDNILTPPIGNNGYSLAKPADGRYMF